MLQTNAPVDTSTEAGVSLTVTGDGGAILEPGTTLNGPASPASAAIARPDHFKEPSGQYARGQVCVGMECPSDVRI
jgi:hypothetical protein